MKEYTFLFYDRVYRVRVRFDRYRSNNGLAVILEDWDDELKIWDTFCDASVNLPFQTDTLPSDCAFIDENNCEGIYDWLIENNIAKRTNYRGQSGFCTYRALRFNNVTK